MSPDLILPYRDARPVFAEPPLRSGPGSSVVGDARIGRGAWIGDHAVIRADGQSVVLGDDVRLGPRATVHIATFSHGTRVGDRVSVGRNAVVHACEVGSDVVIEDDAVILDGARIGDDAVLEAGATVFPRVQLAGGFVYAGTPAAPVRPVGPGEIAERAARLRARLDAAATAPSPESAAEGAAALDAEVFVARTARLAGRVGFGAGVTVLFCCDLDGRAGPITVGAGTNIQDNTVIRPRDGGVVIGRDTTLGHNVQLADCRIGAGSLIGIGARVAPGTVIADAVMLAAGAETGPGQLLEGGYLWGGRPARILAPLDDGKRAMMARIVAGYGALGREYRAVAGAAA